MPTGEDVAVGFHPQGRRVSISDLVPTKRISSQVYQSRKYAQIVASVLQVGLVEPPVVSPDDDGTYLIVDGHIRINVLREIGETEVECLVATDDEAFTYNKRVNRLTLVQEHQMIRQAIRRGAAEATIAAALSMDLTTLRQRNRLLDGICPEAVDLIKDANVPRAVFRVLKRMKPVRQIEAAGLMADLNKFTGRYAEALLAATPDEQLVSRRIKHVPPERGFARLAQLEGEARNIEAQYRAVEESYGQGQLDLVVATAYASRLLQNAEVLRYLARCHIDFLGGLQRICGGTRVEPDQLAAR
ncbi:plasmid partitioning protein RepB C-terminal domain-containing protein [Emcibacter sp. SYSU 3D8]|uniref:plasmid partitioning protein RepB C-terminal domain-containing protein n=1 Tax=Emcibacter sp. SYSU 3D8 TaxID=3133969 RepID=UPI0031FEE2C2